MNEDIREMIDKINNLKQIVNENIQNDGLANVFNAKNPDYLEAWLNVGDEDMKSYYDYGIGGKHPTIVTIINEVKNLKFPLRIYRGIATSNETPNILAEPYSSVGENISWTTNKYVAEKFGNIIYTGIIKTADDINLKYTIQRRIMHKPLDEDEIVMKNNNLIKNIEIFKKV